MNRKYVFAFALTWLFVSNTHAGYDELKKEFEEYKPPSYYTDRERPTLDQAGQTAASDFVDVKKRIADQKAQWERSLAITEDKVLFF